MNDARRAELEATCKAFLEAKPMSIPITDEPECVDALVQFVQQVEREVWTKAVRLAEAAGMVVYVDVFTGLPISFIRKEDDECQQSEGR